MNLRKGFRITTWVISIIAFVGFVAWGIYEVVRGGYEYFFIFFIFAIAFASFAEIWLIYWILFWSVQGFHKIGKKKVLKIIKWAVIIFLASILFHLADYVVHKTTKAFEESLKSKPIRRVKWQQRAS